MFKTILVSAVATIIGAAAFFTAAPSATALLQRNVAAPIPSVAADDVAGDCVIQARWVKTEAGMVKVDRPVCY